MINGYQLIVINFHSEYNVRVVQLVLYEHKNKWVLNIDKLTANNNAYYKVTCYMNYIVQNRLFHINMPYNRYYNRIATIS